MNPFAIFLILMVGGGILFFCLPLMFRDATKTTGARQLFKFVGVGLIAIGVSGFFGSALSSVGGLNWLGHQFEWPVGFASGVVTMEGGVHIVPHTPSGRIQLYDKNWKFIRGWHVGAGGGTFKLVPTGTNTVEVVAARGQWRYIFDLTGNLLHKENYPPKTYSSFPESTEAYFVPTKPWFWVFSHPFLSWGAAVLGGILIGINHKLGKKQKSRSRRAVPQP